ncbi:MAG: hypothetical protein ABMB14_18495 [Myxococcota bacterium]
MTDDSDDSGDDGRFEVAVRTDGWSTAAGLVVGWLLAAGASAGVAGVPVWVGPVVLAAGPVVLVAAGWSALHRRVLVAGRSGVRVRSRPVPWFGDTWIPADDIAFVAIDERILEDSDGHAQRDFRGRPKTAWAVVVHLRGDRSVTVADGLGTGADAKALADRIRAAVHR